MKTKTRKEYFGSTVILFESEIYDGELGDTKVSINGSYILTIAATDIEIFILGINNLNGLGI